ncbi:MAG: hypothetical protein AVDCRST_MAG07-3025, partial [uncultured Frankineae bacterium]
AAMLARLPSGRGTPPRSTTWRLTRARRRPPHRRAGRPYDEERRV